jgi:Ca2+-binding RTX toxin-like protein
MFGESGNDWLGCSGNGNYMAAGAGNDYVAATGNTNLLDGGAGNDTLLAAAGHQGDTFVFHAGYGQDDITGFARHGAGGTDVIDMKGFGLTFASLMNSYATDTANGVLIALDGATSLTIHDVTKAQLAASDFLLA